MAIKKARWMLQIEELTKSSGEKKLSDVIDNVIQICNTLKTDERNAARVWVSMEMLEEAIENGEGTQAIKKYQKRWGMDETD